MTIQVKPDRVRDVIGSGGKTIRAIIEQTGVQINVDDSGRITGANNEQDAADRGFGFIE